MTNACCVAIRLIHSSIVVCSTASLLLQNTLHEPSHISHLPGNATTKFFLLKQHAHFVFISAVHQLHTITCGNIGHSIMFISSTASLLLQNTPHEPSHISHLSGNATTTFFLLKQHAHLVFIAVMHQLHTITYMW